MFDLSKFQDIMSAAKKDGEKITTPLKHKTPPPIKQEKLAVNKSESNTPTKPISPVISDTSVFISKIYATAKETGDKKYSRKIEILLSNDNILSLYWDKYGKLYYTMHPIGVSEGMTGQYIRDHEAYELIIKDGKVIEIKVPETIKENPEEFAGNRVAPRELNAKETKEPMRFVPCTIHKTYTAKRQPRTDCPQCRKLYKQMHPETQ